MNPTRPLRLHASSSLLSKLTPSISSLTKTLHPPLLTKRETTTLLTTVQDSFRNHLASTDTTFDSFSPSSHLAGILKSTHFSSAPSSPGESRLLREKRIKKFLDDPIAVFEDFVAQGIATPRYARSCLIRYNDQGGAVPGGTGGERVLKGLITAGEYDRRPNVAMSILVITLAREGKDKLLSHMLKENIDIAPRMLEWIATSTGYDRAVELFLRLVSGFIEKGHLRHRLREDCEAGLKLGSFAIKALKLANPPLTPDLVKRLVCVSRYWSRSDIDHAMIQMRFGNSTRAGLDLIGGLDKKTDEWWEQQTAKKKHLFMLVATELWNKCTDHGNLEDARIITTVMAKLSNKPKRITKEEYGLKGVEGQHGLEGVEERLHVFKDMFGDVFKKGSAVRVI